MKKLLLNFEEVVAAIVLLFMTLLTFVNVVSRYCLSTSLSITDELTTYFCVLLSLLGAAIAAKRGAHLGLTVVTDMLPKTVRRYLALFSSIVSTGFAALICYHGVFMVIDEYTLGLLTSGLQVPEWWYGIFVPIGAAVLCFRFAERGIKDFIASKEDAPAKKEVE